MGDKVDSTLVGGKHHPNSTSQPRTNSSDTKSDEPAPQRDEPADRWAVRSPTARHEPDRQIEPDASAPDKYNDTAHNGNYSDDREIHFGLSPHALFERANNHGAYREFSHHGADGTQRGFEFHLDGNQHDDEPFGGYASNDGQSAGNDHSFGEYAPNDGQSAGNDHSSDETASDESHSTGNN